MADLESRVDKLETKGSSIEVTVEKLSQKVDDFIGEMRQQNAMRAAEIARIDEKIEQLREQREKDNAKHEEDIKEINKKIEDKFDKIGEKVDRMYERMNNTALTTILGVEAIVIAVMGFAWAVFAPSNPAPVQIQQPPAQTAQIQTVP